MYFSFIFKKFSYICIKSYTMTTVTAPIPQPDYGLDKLVTNISELVDKSKSSLAKTVNRTIVNTYWNIGRYIIEFEQNGNAKSKYGTHLLTTLSKRLTAVLGAGFSRPNLNNMRKFYLLYPICQTVSDKLSWSHICELLPITDSDERSFYERECVATGWSVSALKRQIKSGLYLRLAASTDKAGILELANSGIVITKPEDAVKDIYTLEFLGLSDKVKFKESELEKSIIDNLQTFLLELGKGFAYVGRQYSLTIGNRHYHVDLVFYHVILKCYVLIDLKINAVRHYDIGQMNMYMGYFAKEISNNDDNPPIGIILSRNNDELLVEYATYGLDANLFVSKYELYLPNKDELRRFINHIKND